MAHPLDVKGARFALDKNDEWRVTHANVNGKMQQLPGSLTDGNLPTPEQYAAYMAEQGYNLLGELPDAKLRDTVRSSPSGAHFNDFLTFRAKAEETELDRIMALAKPKPSGDQPVPPGQAAPSSAGDTPTPDAAPPEPKPTPTPEKPKQRDVEADRQARKANIRLIRG